MKWILLLFSLNVEQFTQLKLPYVNPPGTSGCGISVRNTWAQLEADPNLFDSAPGRFDSTNGTFDSYNSSVARAIGCTISPTLLNTWNQVEGH